MITIKMSQNDSRTKSESNKKKGEDRRKCREMQRLVTQRQLNENVNTMQQIVTQIIL